MRYLVIREDGIIIGSFSSDDGVGAAFLPNCPNPRALPLEPMITRAIERPGAKAKLYCIEPSPHGSVVAQRTRAAIPQASR